MAEDPHELVTIEYEDILLRDEAPGDSDDFRRWNREETGWRKWDSPWENAMTAEAKEERKRWWEVEKLYRERRLTEMGAPRRRLQICHADGTHIGWVNSYLAPSPNEGLAVGINVAESLYWGRGLGTQALRAWIGYLFQSTQLDELLCQTWSGNTRMVHVAETCGFEECHRTEPVREADGVHYVHLTFRVDRDTFFGLHPTLADEMVVKTRPRGTCRQR